MKLIKIGLCLILLAGFVYRCKAQSKDCKQGIETAKKDLKDNKLGLYNYGLPIPSTTTYHSILREEYNITLKGGGDIINDFGKCYNDLMIPKIKAKHGDDIFKKA